MRLDDNTLVLSERNLLTLLTKLYQPSSAAMIEGGSDCPMYVKAEKDEEHYQDRPAPGPMHPATERVLTAIQEHAAGEEITPARVLIIQLQPEEAEE